MGSARTWSRSSSRRAGVPMSPSLPAGPVPSNTGPRAHLAGRGLQDRGVEPGGVGRATRRGEGVILVATIEDESPTRRPGGHNRWTSRPARLPGAVTVVMSGPLHHLTQTSGLARRIGGDGAI